MFSILTFRLLIHLRTLKTDWSPKQSKFTLLLTIRRLSWPLSNMPTAIFFLYDLFWVGERQNRQRRRRNEESRSISKQYFTTGGFWYTIKPLNFSYISQASIVKPLQHCCIVSFQRPGFSLTRTGWMIGHQISNILWRLIARREPIIKRLLVEWLCKRSRCYVLLFGAQICLLAYCDTSSKIGPFSERGCLLQQFSGPHFRSYTKCPW